MCSGLWCCCQWVCCLWHGYGESGVTVEWGCGAYTQVDEMFKQTWCQDACQDRETIQVLYYLREVAPFLRRSRRGRGVA